MDKDDYNYIMYRETSDDSWGILPNNAVHGSKTGSIGEGNGRYKI